MTAAIVSNVSSGQPEPVTAVLVGDGRMSGDVNVFVRAHMTFDEQVAKSLAEAEKGRSGLYEVLEVAVVRRAVIAPKVTEFVVTEDTAP